jgi:NAD(P)-dependent dehydrogenase (short-subunit alcohol dehydrogenase family)
MSYNPYSLEGKTILITGSSSGIGRFTAIECSKMGAKLIITGRDELRLKETFEQLAGEDHKYIVADLVTEEGLDRLISETKSLNGLVLCAGRGITVPIPFATRDKFNDVFNVNLFSPIELLRLLFRKKKLIKESSVVFISSIGGIKSFNYGNAVYGASKAAFSSIMKFCAKEFAVKGIRVNSVNPGMVETKLINGEIFTQEQRQSDIQNYLLQRYGQPEDIAYSVIFLLSDASSWITGLELVIDGGYTI